MAAALNGNKTDQSIDQTQGGKGDGSLYLQAAGQESKNVQSADADAFALQKGASNENAPVSVLSKGGRGDVSQSNSNTALAAALNGNKTDQSIDQTQGGKGDGSLYLQAAGQSSKNVQWADADAFALQKGASNENAPVSVLSKGGRGDVSQSNSTTALAAALNGNKTDQSIDQTQGSGKGDGSLYLQAAGQQNASWQGASAGVLAAQRGASNRSAPVRVASPDRHSSLDPPKHVGLRSRSTSTPGCSRSIKHRGWANHRRSSFETVCVGMGVIRKR